MLKSFIASWRKRHEHKPEETKMTDEVQGAPVDAGSQAAPVTVQVQGAVSLVDDAPAHHLASPDLGYVEPEGIKVLAGAEEGKHDAFAEKLRHVLKLAEVEIDHLWDEAVALAKKLA